MQKLWGCHFFNKSSSNQNKTSQHVRISQPLKLQSCYFFWRDVVGVSVKVLVSSVDPNSQSKAIIEVTNQVSRAVNHCPASRVSKVTFCECRCAFRVLCKCIVASRASALITTVARIGNAPSQRWFFTHEYLWGCQFFKRLRILNSNIPATVAMESLRSLLLWGLSERLPPHLHADRKCVFAAMLFRPQVLFRTLVTGVGTCATFEAK